MNTKTFAFVAFAPFASVAHGHLTGPLKNVDHSPLRLSSVLAPTVVPEAGKTMLSSLGRLSPEAVLIPRAVSARKGPLLDFSAAEVSNPYPVARTAAPAPAAVGTFVLGALSALRRKRRG